jgi:hypothetical protein
MRSRNLVYAIACAALFAVFLRLQVAVWFLFLIFSIYFGSKVFMSKAGSQVSTSSESLDIPFGVLGSYPVDGDAEDLSYGMYIKLAGRPVFIDLREDELLDLRKNAATALSNNVNQLETNLQRFVSGHPEFSNRHIASIGLHSSDISRMEVFWEPEGYTIIQDLNFV